MAWLTDSRFILTMPDISPLFKPLLHYQRQILTIWMKEKSNIQIHTTLTIAGFEPNLILASNNNNQYPAIRNHTFFHLRR